MSALAASVEFANYVSTHRAEFVKLQRWQREFIAMTARYPHCMVSAGNQTGKTWTMAYLARCHLTGQYPEWWNGARLEQCRKAWAAGVDWKQIGRVWTKALLGKIDEVTREPDYSGVLSPEDVRHVRFHPQHRTSAERIVVNRADGGVVTLEMIAYSQTGAEKKQAQSLAGETNLDLLLIDEQPPDIALGQMVMRTAHGEHVNGTGDTVNCGLVLIGMTPELGATPLYEEFAQQKNPSQGFLNVTWDDCDPWVLSDEQKAIIRDSLRPHEREMREKGIPIRGSGLVYPVAESAIECEPFPIPEFWPRLIGIDFGFEHPFAAIGAAHDAENDIVYAVAEYQEKHQTPLQHAAAIKSMGYTQGVPVSYPHDAHGTEKGSGDTLWMQYQSAGIKRGVPFRNKDGSIYVEPGISELYERMTTGRYKVFATLGKLKQQRRMYHRNNNRIVKANDDLMDAERIAVVMVPIAGRSIQMANRKFVQPKINRYG